MLSISQLIWDSWNVTHIARHGVTPDEVEQVCLSDPSIEQGYAGRLRLVGVTQSGRVLAVVLAPKAPGVFYPVTARDASRKERREYNKGGEQAA